MEKNKESEIAELKAEILELKKELIIVCNEIKSCRDKDDRQIMFEEKKQIQGEIDFAKNQLATLEELDTLSEDKIDEQLNIALSNTEE